MEGSESVVLRAPAQQVWDVIQNEVTALDPAIVAFEVEPAPGVGATNRITFRGPLGLRLRAASTTEVWDPPWRFVARSLTPAWPVRSRVEDVLDEEAAGTTRYTVSVTVQPRAFTRPLGRLWLRYLLKTRRQMMARLKDLLEARS